MAGDLTDWSNKQGVLISCAAGAAGVLVTTIVAIWLAQPNYHPSAIFQPPPGQDAQRIVDLTKESQTCDAAIRSMLLAVANEIEQDATIPAMEQVSSLVESDFALVPPACQELIDPLSASSDGNLKMSIVEARANTDRAQFGLRLFNSGDAAILVATDTYPEVEITDNLADRGYNYYVVTGVHKCSISCGDSDAQKFTRIDPDSAASITVQASARNYSRGKNPKTASLALALYESDGEVIIGTRSFGFADVPVK